MAIIKAATHLRRAAPVPQCDAGSVPLRTPTEAMLIAARDWSYLAYGKPIGNNAAIGCWQAMFDAALVSPPSEAGREAVIEECAKYLEKIGARYHGGRDLPMHLRALSHPDQGTVAVSSAEGKTP